MITQLDGLDVSSIQGEIDWAEVRAHGYRWCYIRLTRGVDEVDSMAEANFAGCVANGIIPGFYHRAFPLLGNPDVQAAHFAAHLSRLETNWWTTLPPCLDYEEKVRKPEWAQEFITRTRVMTGRFQSMLYASGSYVDTYLGGEAWMDPGISLWIADSGKFTGATKGKPKYLTPRVVAHQYGQSRDVPGIPAAATQGVDVDVTTGDLLALAGR